MTGPRRKSLTQKLREDAIFAALLAEGSVAGASRASGYSESTVRRLLAKSEPFRKRLDACRTAATRAIVAGLAGSTSDALVTLKRLLTCGKESVEAKSASVILAAFTSLDSHRAGMDEIAELRERLAAIEAAAKGTS